MAEAEVRRRTYQSLLHEIAALYTQTRAVVKAHQGLIARMERKMHAKLAEIWREEERAKG